MRSSKRKSTAIESLAEKHEAKKSDGSFFISYNHSDSSWAEWIAWTIEELGFSVSIEAWDFLPGSTWPHEMQVRLQKCRALVLVLSPDSMSSGFVESEWQIAFAEDPTGKQRRLIPIRVRECEVDGLLKTRIHIDLVGKNRDLARKLIHQAILGERLKPETEPDFPGNSSFEPVFPGIESRHTRFAIVLDGVFDEYDRERVELLARHLRKILKDSTLTIEGVRKGSVIVTVDASRSAYERFKGLVKHDPHVMVMGDRLVAQWRLLDDGQDPLTSRLKEYEGLILPIFLREVDAETARDLAQEFVLAVLTLDEEKYAILQSPARAAKVAESLLVKYLEERAKEANARRAVVKEDTESFDRTGLLRLSMIIFENLSPEEKQLMENYWSARFEGHTLLDEAEYRSRSVEEKYRKQLESGLSDYEE